MSRVYGLHVQGCHQRYNSGDGGGGGGSGRQSECAALLLRHDPRLAAARDSIGRTGREWAVVKGHARAVEAAPSAV